MDLLRIQRSDTIKSNSATCWICAWNSADSTWVLRPRLSSAQSSKSFSAPQAARPQPVGPKTAGINSWTNTGGETTARAAVPQEGVWQLLLLINETWCCCKTLTAINCINGGGSEVSKNWLGKRGRTAYLKEGKTKEVRRRHNGRRKQLTLTLKGSLKAFRYGK